LAGVAAKLAKKRVNIDYLYGSTAGKGKASIIVKVGNMAAPERRCGKGVHLIRVPCLTWRSWMKPITFDTRCYRVEGEPIYLYSGEFHYFRVPRRDWVERMRLLKETGGNCVATYVPWLLHEPEEGKFVFGGNCWTSSGSWRQRPRKGFTSSPVRVLTNTPS